MYACPLGEVRVGRIFSFTLISLFTWVNGVIDSEGDDIPKFIFKDLWFSFGSWQKYCGYSFKTGEWYLPIFLFVNSSWWLSLDETTADYLLWWFLGLGGIKCAGC